MAAPSASISFVFGCVKTAIYFLYKSLQWRKLSLRREYHKQLFGPMFYSWCSCPLIMELSDEYLMGRIAKCNWDNNFQSNFLKILHSFKDILISIRLLTYFMCEWYWYIIICIAMEPSDYNYIEFCTIFLSLIKTPSCTAGSIIYSAIAHSDCTNV